MRNVLNQFIKLIVAIVLMAVIISSTLVVLIFNTATLKPFISDQIMMLTGRAVVIDGGVHWSFFPGLAVNVNHVHFIQSKYSKQLVSTDILNMKMGLRLLPLLYGKMEAADVEATIETHSLHSDVSANIKLNSHVKFNFQKKIYTFPDLILSVQAKNKNRIVMFDMTGDVVADLGEQTIAWNHLTCQSDMVAMSGNIAVSKILGTPIVSGRLNVRIPDLLKAARAIGQNPAFIQEAKNINGNVDFQYLRGVMDVNGDVLINNIQTGNVKLADFNAHIAYKNQEFVMTDMMSKVYGGSFSGKGKVNLAFDYPQLAMEGKLSHIESALLWKELVGDNHKINVTGTGDVSFQFKTVGNDSKKIIKNLTGTSVIDLTDGYVLGTDLVFWINHAFVPLNKKAVFPDKVIFSKLTGTMTMKDGVIENNDLVLEMPELVAKGKGQIDLARHSVEYVLHTSVKKVIFQKVGNVTWTNNSFVPIHIKGNLANPEVYVKNNSV